MLIGYARVSKADGSQSLDLQHDALRAAGVERDNIYPECFTNRLIPPSCSSGCVFFQPTDNPAPFFAHPNPLSKSIPLRVMLKFLR